MAEGVISNCFNFGDLVKINLLELTGYITAICYRGGYITYEVTYFSNGEHNQKWFEYFELENPKKSDIRKAV
jgi:hypothetical protein